MYVQRNTEALSRNSYQGKAITNTYLFLFGWLRVPTCSLAHNQPGTPVYKMTTRGYLLHGAESFLRS